MQHEHTFLNYGDKIACPCGELAPADFANQLQGQTEVTEGAAQTDGGETATVSTGDPVQAEWTTQNSQPADEQPTPEQAPQESAPVEEPAPAESPAESVAPTEEPQPEATTQEPEQTPAPEQEAAVEAPVSQADNKGVISDLLDQAHFAINKVKELMS